MSTQTAASVSAQTSADADDAMARRLRQLEDDALRLGTSQSHHLAAAAARPAAPTAAQGAAQPQTEVIQSEGDVARDGQHDDAVHRMKFDTNRLTYQGGARTPLRQPDVSPQHAARLDRRVADRMRVAKARGDTMTYRQGKAAAERSKDFIAAEERFRPMPDTLEGLYSLAEERIEEARRNGAFTNLEGKGKALEMAETRTPMVDRTEYFLNQIIKKQGALPPFVDAQVQLDRATGEFRQALRHDWAMFACKLIAMSGGPLEAQVRRAADYASAEARGVDRLRDSNWERREWSFIQARVADLNSKIRGYNIIAPFNSRRVYLQPRRELDDALREAMQTVPQMLVDRANAPKLKETHGYKVRFGKSSILDHLVGRVAKSQFYEREAGQYGFGEWWRDTFGRKRSGESLYD